MTTQDILALSPGAPLDQAVHQFVFGETGKAPAYSTDEATALRLLDRLPMFVGRVPADYPKQDPARPFVAGTLRFEPAISGEAAGLRVSAASRAVAICKAALLVIFQPAKTNAGRQPGAASITVQTQTPAQELAARVGTPAARGPLAAAAAAAQKQRKAAAKAPRGKVKIGGGVASAPVRAPAVAQNPPRRNQPGVFVHAREQLKPMPPRNLKSIPFHVKDGVLAPGRAAGT